MEALSYMHKIGVIHRDIKSENILIDNNMSIKIGDFGVSAMEKRNDNVKYKNPYYKGEINNIVKIQKELLGHGTIVGTGEYMSKEMLEGDHDYNQKVDVYSMGCCFYEMCFLRVPNRQIEEKTNLNPNKDYALDVIIERPQSEYSKELIDIVFLMLEQNKEQRKTSQEIYDIIKSLYYKKYIKYTSIDCLVRCLLLYQHLNNYFFNLQNYQVNNKPMVKAYLELLRNFSNNNNNNDIQNAILNFRKSLHLFNPKFSGYKEIEPKYIFAFLMTKMHMELNEPDILKDSNITEVEKKTYNIKPHIINTGEDESKTNIIAMMIKFINEYKQKFNSYLSNSFGGFLKTTKTCEVCNLTRYSFSSYFFVTFDLEKISQYTGINIFNIEIGFKFQNQNILEENSFCHKCLNKTRSKCYIE
jgi:serine/threonine protein kinase